MTKTNSELLLASKNAATGDILYSFRLTFPHVILTHLLTHRVFSRNTSSGRAIPGKKTRSAVINDPFIPTFLGRNQKGMQAGAEITGWRRKATLAAIRLGRYPAVFLSWLLETLGAHKQVSNRFLEPWLWVTQIMSTTELDNFFALRNHPDAEPHLHQLAAQMQEQVEEAVSEFAHMEHIGSKYDSLDDGTRLQILAPGEWHTPLLHPWEWVSNNEAKKISAARCARTSYTLIETGKESSMEKDIELCDKLLTGSHHSPFEHQAEAIADSVFVGNFKGFSQFRKELETI